MKMRSAQGSRVRVGLVIGRKEFRESSFIRNIKCALWLDFFGFTERKL